MSCETLLEKLGEMPLPPYIHEKLTDQSRYQTVYARFDGSAAAPTAGLHFTDRVLSAVGELFSTQRLAVLELGYGGEDLDPGPWWFGSPDDLAAGRHAVARHVTAAALGRPRAWGAPFWWYYLEDEAPGAAGGPVHEDLTQAAEHG